jgi:exosortase
MSDTRTCLEPRDAAAAPRRPRRRWTHWHTAAALAMSALAVLATRDVWADVVSIVGRDDEQSHVLLVPIVAAWLAWVRRERLRHYEPASTWAGPAIAAAGAVMLRVGDAALVQSMWHLGAVVIVVGAFVSVAGAGVLVRLLPAFVALAVLVPVPARVREAVAIPLQSATARVTQTALDTMGVAVERWGNTLRIDGRDVTIAEACNGLRMAFALMLVTFAFAYGVPLRNGVRVLLVAVSPLVAIAFNVLRLVPTVWACGRLRTDIAMPIHDAAAWLMLPCALLCLFGLLRLLRWAQIPVTPHVLASGS